MLLQEGEHFFARDISVEGIRVYRYAMRMCVRVYVYVCVFFFHFKVLCLAVPNGMGVEAGDALLDEGPQSLPAMRL